MNDATRDELRTLQDRAETICEGYATTPIWWISGGDDASEDYCETCVRSAVDEANSRGEDWGVDGGWCDERESDVPGFCCSCGCQLGYKLTEAGLSDEVEHMEASPPERPVSSAVAYALAAMLEASKHYDDVDLAARVLTIASSCTCATSEANASEFSSIRRRMLSSVS